MRKIEQIFKYHRCIINGGRPFKTRQKKVTEITSFIFYDDKKILGKVGFQQQKCISFVALEFRCIYIHNVTKRFLKSHCTFYETVKYEFQTLRSNKYPYILFDIVIEITGSKVFISWKRWKNRKCGFIKDSTSFCILIGRKSKTYKTLLGIFCKNACMQNCKINSPFLCAVEKKPFKLL